MKITYYGHSCFAVETMGKRLLFDPFISGNPHAKSIDINSIQADFILISHGHGDHCTDAEQIAKANHAMIISNYEIVSWFEKKGIQGHSLNTGGTWKFDFGVVKYVHALHSSSLPDGTYGGNPGGFVIWNEEGCFYFAGDTALTLDMKLIPVSCPALDFAILPVGDNYTMGYQDASIAAEYIDCDTIIGCHFDTFGHIKLDHKAAKETFEARGKKLILPFIGDQMDID